MKDKKLSGKQIVANIGNNKRSRLKDGVTDAVKNYENLYTEQPPPEINVNIRYEKKKVPMEPNVMVFQKFAYYASVNLSPSTCKILFFMVSLSAYENYLQIDVQTIMDELAIKSKTTVVNALKELEKHKVLMKIQHPIDKRRHDYFINPISMWKGHGWAQKKMIDKIRKSDPQQLEMGF
jgi:predicted transcriptional regulator